MLSFLDYASAYYKSSYLLVSALIFLAFSTSIWDLFSVNSPYRRLAAVLFFYEAAEGSVVRIGVVDVQIGVLEPA